MTDLQIDFDGNEVPIADSKPKPKRRGGQAGRARERQVADKLRSEDWLVIKGTTYGTCDLVAVRELPSRTGCEVWLIEVKSTKGGPYQTFGPNDRADLKAEADRVGAAAVLAWWPPRGKLRFLFASEWP
jgi:Holliday junction resolvase